jgi:hypothetical protein
MFYSEDVKKRTYLSSLRYLGLQLEVTARDRFFIAANAILAM